MPVFRCVLSLICLGAAACGPSGNDTTASERAASAEAQVAEAAQQAAVGPPPPTGLTPGPAPAACDSPAVPIATGEDIRGEVQATSAPYPANARYYCFAVPAGESLARVSLTGLSADLDLYVGHGAIDTVQGVDLTIGETYEWKSNAFGTADESVTIVPPQPGVYYVEIVSYEGDRSPFVLSVR